MSSSTLELEASLLVKDDCGHCLEELRRVLSVKTGIERVHLSADPPRLCLHFDPNLVSVTAVERMAHDLGGELQGRFHHQRFKLLGSHAADMSGSLEQQLSEINGVLHANVNVASSVVSVAYDSDRTNPQALEEALNASGIQTERFKASCCGGHRHHHQQDEKPKVVQEHEHSHAQGKCGHSHHHEHKHGAGCEHGKVPGFLPAWVQERWTLLLVAACGLFFLFGWLGENFFQLPSQIALGCYVLAYIAGAYDISTHAIPGLFKGRFNTDILMLAAAAGAAVLWQWAEGAFLLFLFSLGHAGEHYALDRARNAIDALGALMPSSALIKQGEHLVDVPVEQVVLGSIAVVRPGDRIPVDGKVLRGDSSVDQSPITGESAPLKKVPGDQVFAGTINLENTLEVEVEKLASDSTLSRVVQMVAEAQEQKSPTQDFTQKFSAKFVPAILLFTLLLIFVPPTLDWMSMRESFYRAMLLLVASSPCALALGTPAAVLAGIGQAARNGVLIKGGLHLENLGRIRVMAFDKTGTLTEGKFQVTDLVTEAAESQEELLGLCASVEQQSSHPLAQAMVAAAKGKALELRDTEPLQNLAGLGVSTTLAGEKMWLGSRKLFAENEAAPSLSESFEQKVIALEAAGKTVVVVGRGSQTLGVVALADTARPESLATLKTLTQLGMTHLVMLTGDHEAAANLVASQVGVTDVRAGLMPEEKWTATKELRKEYGALAMVGDGVNDAPALAAADVGIAMGGAGTAVALETADVALMGDDLSRLPYAVGLSRKSRVIIKQNLALSMGVILMLVVSSVSGFGELSWTVAVHEGSTLVVVANALRLLRYKGPV